MIPLLTRDQARAIDQHAVGTLGLSNAVLMENAGAGAARVLLERFGDRAGSALILAGTGQNGGDGWVVARHLYSRGLRPRAVLLGRESTLTGDARTNYEAFQALGGDVQSAAPGAPSLAAYLGDADLVVDAIFGTGLNRPVSEGYAETIDRINERAGRAVVSLDLPSGVDADTGAVLGAAIRATVTVTFAGHKRGLHQAPGADLAGHVVPVGIGTPSTSTEAALLELADVRSWLPTRPRDAHKNAAGHVVVFAGSAGRTGAAVLGGYGALRGGAGLVTVVSRRSAVADLLPRLPLEVMSASLDDGPHASAGSATDAALELAEAADSNPARSACVVGPGFGTDEWGQTVAWGVIEKLPRPLVVDADGLTAVANAGLPALRGCPGPRVLTPHPGEAARLLGCAATEIQADRYAAAREMASRSGAVVVLKGARTVIAEPGGRLRVSPFAVPALGVAGSGDVLVGILAAAWSGHEPLAPARDPLVAASVAVVVHAVAGQIAARSDRGLLASEVAEQTPAALERCRAIVPTRWHDL